MPMNIRVATEGDAEPVLEIYAPFCVATPISFETEPPSLEEIGRRIAKTLAFFPWLICEEEGRVVGYAYASRHRERAAYRWSADVSVYVREKARGRGIGRALYTSLFAILRLQQIYNILAGITLPNPASIALHEAMGLHRSVCTRVSASNAAHGTTWAGGSSSSCLERESLVNRSPSPPSQTVPTASKPSRPV